MCHHDFSRPGGTRQPEGQPKIDAALHCAASWKDVLSGLAPDRHLAVMHFSIAAVQAATSPAPWHSRPTGATPGAPCRWASLSATDCLRCLPRWSAAQGLAYSTSRSHRAQMPLGPATGL